MNAANRYTPTPRPVQGHHARKRFGQNFLVDQGIIDQIARAIDAREGQLVVEIGPGLGALTRRILADIQPLHVIELDRDLVARLTQQYPTSQLVVHAGDALAFNFAELAQAAGLGLRVIGNLPYNISSPLLFHLQQYRAHILDQHFMLQKEVVMRLVAEPGTKAYSRLSVMLQLDYDMTHLFDVPPHCFNPPPQVDSAIVRMQPREYPGSENLDRTLFAKLVTQAFSQRRKVLKNTLSELLAGVDYAACGLDMQARAEEIGLPVYVAVTHAWQQARLA
ncbi:16S rRNA (adenine(1518)-N(6)/adenine(1519)-N(6))-dimethyltransferase RsmA [Parvibium lacunae]|uniref:Ribosomal RNA small subunit methyltransferase A n=1 Tax=Parvibium lacunae TaxID=1888893 RepID=A0A368L480_9BURK|nr:16S rRNA (adenine(1518)-N(6)/adenine(1519)-N(6))-dimethyltransferase RsmA [Parvibium lacunae]RCS58388.1 16S rRNA (adenine(1518)-N(6)/adenine(1519)-N(6))-dimethyltransferase RsmA [Parvibium lacunae]